MALVKFDEELREMCADRLALIEAEDTFFTTALTRKSCPQFQEELKKFNSKQRNAFH